MPVKILDEVEDYFEKTVSELDKPISITELNEAIANLSSGKAPGPDKIPNTVLKIYQTIFGTPSYKFLIARFYQAVHQ
ncbi:unnamed protein product, partial [Allacma fusca]